MVSVEETGVVDDKFTPPRRERTNPLLGVLAEPGKGRGVVAASKFDPNGRRPGVLEALEIANVGLAAFVADFGKGRGVVIIAPLAVDCA